MSDLLPPPYPPTVRSKGWRFELDTEQIDQSETWPLAAEVPMAQHALLMMWMVAWAKQVPCGSFPDDEDVIRAACRIPPAMWPKLRGVLMRGWWKADDGRLYHPTLTARVLEMMRKRRSDADRTAAKRARDAAESAATHTDVTRDKPVTPPEVPPESSTDHRPLKKSSPSSKTVSKPSASHPSAEGFAEFWLAWPKNERKQDKTACLDLWKRRGYSALAAVILADVRVKRGTEKWADGFIESPLVYLRRKRWEDGVTPNSEGQGEDLGDWRKDRKSVEAKALSIGLQRWDEDGFQNGRHRENFAAYEARVAARVEQLEGAPA